MEITGETPDQPGIQQIWLSGWYPMKDSTGAVVNLSVVVEEVTEQRQLEDQLRQSQKMEALGTLAGGIAHDFNNMLAAILGCTEMALEDLPDRPDVQRNLQNVSRTAMRA
jgi:signal transduction histidine kinase